MNGRHSLARLWLVGLLLLAAARSAWSADSSRKLSPLIQLQGNEFLCTRTEHVPLCCDVCAEGMSRERTISIFRNTRALSVTTEAEYDRHRPITSTPAASALHDGFLTGRQLQDLNGFLQRIQIGVRIGQCNPFGIAPLSTARYTIFWYGADGRRSTVTFGREFTRVCPQAILDLFNTVVQLGDAIR